MFKVRFNGKIHKVYHVHRCDNGTILFLIYDDSTSDYNWHYIFANQCKPYESEVEI